MGVSIMKIDDKLFLNTFPKWSHNWLRLNVIRQKSIIIRNSHKDVMNELKNITRLAYWMNSVTHKKFPETFLSMELTFNGALELLDDTYIMI
jgi:hypothetical protein